MRVSTPYLPSIATHTSPSDEMRPKAVGSTWLHNYDGKLWPVVLCDDTTPPTAFMRTRPSGYVLPALLLGKIIYIWVADNRLREFDPREDYLDRLAALEPNDVQESDDREVKVEKLRRKAFSQDALRFESPAFWKNYIEQRSVARTLEREMARRRKRPNSDEDALNKIKRRLSGKRYLPTPNPTPVTAILSGWNEGQGEESASDENDLFVGQAKSGSDPFASDDEDAAREIDERLRIRRAENLKVVKDNPPGDDECTLFVGEEQTPFSVPKTRTEHCQFLLDRVAFTEELKFHIDLSELTETGARAFIPLVEYLRTGDFTPRLVDSGIHQRLEGVVLESSKPRAAEKIATIYLTASKLRMSTLQLLCLNKIRALHALDSEDLWTVLTLIAQRAVHDCEAESETRRWAADSIVENFWTFVECHGVSFSSMMREQEALKNSVLGALASNAEAGH